MDAICTLRDGVACKLVLREDGGLLVAPCRVGVEVKPDHVAVEVIVVHNVGARDDIVSVLGPLDTILHPAHDVTEFRLPFTATSQCIH